MSEALTLNRIPILPDSVEISQECVESAAAARAQAEAISGIGSQADYEKAEDALKLVTRISNQIDKQRLAFVSPLTSLAKTAKLVADKHRGPLEKAKERLKKIMAAYVVEQRRIQEEKLAAAVAEQEKRERETAKVVNPFAAAIGDIAPVLPLIPPVTLEMSKPVETQRSAVLEKWMWSVEDESKIPREFLCIDQRKIDGLVREHKGSLTIPGIRVFSEISVRSR